MRFADARFCLAFFLAAAVVAVAELPAGPEFSTAPRAAVSSDGFIRVVAYDDVRDEVGFRLPILAFASKTVDALANAYDLKRVKVKEPGLVIYAMDGRTNDTRLLGRQETRKSGSVVVKVFLPSPGYSDLEDLRIAIARSFFGMNLPDWMVQGLLRSQDDTTRRDDERFVLSLWSSARLPFFHALCTDLRVSKGKAAALPGYIAGWVKEKKLLGTLREGAWDGKRLAQLLTGETDPVLQDRASDERLARLARSVLEPGECGLWELDFFSSRLFLYSPVFDATLVRGRHACSFRDAVAENGSNLIVRAAAFLKAREIPIYALGRGDELQAVAASYERLLLGIAAGEERAKLDEMLDSADSRLELAYEKRRKDNHRGR